MCTLNRTSNKRLKKVPTSRVTGPKEQKQKKEQSLRSELAERSAANELRKTSLFFLFLFATPT